MNGRCEAASTTAARVTLDRCVAETMQKSLLPPIGALAVLTAALTGCTSSHGQAAAPSHSATPPSAAAPAASKLADPMQRPLPLRTKVLAERSGTGQQALDMSHLPGSAKAIQVNWVCVGHGRLEITDGTKMLLGSGCASNLAQATTVYGGKIPRKDGMGLSWQAKTNPGTVWRLAVTTAE